ncbi:PAS domain S-box protein [Ancylothrix sp. C2]|uniref:PAS domain-containing sensor histidine kinase n=1 Tax=Ancylothrix sp. D3o TaxID=2953691 RepID=UPI0021BADBB8|nr:PAS domain S-box protein [Ancylothrix sp. D3o]MCT7950835.1 PAS domain S-box protein [Ancylothrix sp. D3o]
MVNVKKITELRTKRIKAVEGGYTKEQKAFITKEFVEGQKVQSGSNLVDSLRQALDFYQMKQELRNSQQELQVLDERFRNVIDKNADSIIIVDEGGRICFANPASELLLNCSVSEVLGKELFGKFVIENSSYDMNTDILPMGKDAANAKMRVVQLQVDIQPWYGEKAIAEMRVVETKWEGKLAFLVLLRDVTERKLALDALRRERDFTKTLVEASPAFFMALTAEKKILMINEAMLGALGYTLEEVENQDYLSMLVGSGERVKVCEEFERLIKFKEKVSGETHILAKDGKLLLVEWHSRPVFRVDGELDFILAMGIDITERKKAEIALKESEARLREQTEYLQKTLYELQRTQAQLVQTEKMSCLGQMVAGIAHEINNPVNFIYANLCHANKYMKDLLELVNVYQQHYPKPNSEILEKIEEIDFEFLREDFPKLLGSMAVGAERIGDIVLNLRNFSRMDEAEMKPVNIHDGIDSTLMILQNRLKAKGSLGEIKVVKEYGGLPLVECYAGALNQVFMNILANGIDALEERQRECHKNQENRGSFRNDEREIYVPQIEISTSLKDDKFVKIRIADNGMGMSEEVRKRLFDLFFTTKPVGKGTGLGMSISYQIVVEKHGGNLMCNSAPGEGAEFVIEIPISPKFRGNC